MRPKGRRPRSKNGRGADQERGPCRSRPVAHTSSVRPLAVAVSRCAGRRECATVSWRHQPMEAEMSSVETSSESAAGSPPVKAGEMRLEVVVLPVSDVDRAKRFYEWLGWRLDADLAVDDGYRVVQLTPPGSACSIIFGEGVTSAPPGSCRGPAALGLRHRRGPCRPRRARGRGQRAVPRRDRASSTTPGPRGA